MSAPPDPPRHPPNIVMARPGARIAIQQRVTKNFFFTFSTDVTNAQQDIIQGEYQLNKRWGLEADRDEMGNIGVSAKYHTSF